MREIVDRRNWLKTVGLAAVGAGLGVHCASPLEPNLNGTQLQRVHVSRNRIIRTTVGLRPTRPSGFVLRSETFGDKTIIHNFGHGGSGMSLGGLLTWPGNWHLRLAPPRLPLSERVLSACRPRAYSNRRVIK